MQSIVQLDCLKHNNQQICMLDIGKSTLNGSRTLCQSCFNNLSQKENVIFLASFYEKLNQHKDKEHRWIEDKKQELHKKLSPLIKHLQEAQNRLIKILEFAQTEFQQFQSIIEQSLNNMQVKLAALGQNPTISQLEELAERIGKGDRLIPFDFSAECEKMLTNRQQNSLGEQSRRLQELFKEIKNIFSYLENKNINEFVLAYESQVDKLCQSIGVNYQDRTVAISEDKDISLWNLDNYAFDKIDYLKGHLEKVTCIQFSQQQNWFVSGSDDQTLKIWKMNKDLWCCTQTLDGHQNYISDIKISNDENTLISSSFDFKIKIWQQKDQKIWFCSQTLDNHKNYVYYLSINGSNTLFASSSWDFTLKIWQLKSRKWEQYRTIEKRQNEWIKRICFLNDTQIACQIVGQPKIVIMQVIGNNEISQLQEIPLTENDDEYSYNPMIYFQKKKLIILKNNKSTLILQEKNNGLFQLIHTIKGNHQSPTIITTGKSLIMFEKDKKKLQLFKTY
ncbi:unnamed protein product (macronuclear) [Paramecium tetraurelia]|uniref:Uncharacterized protein n=1 Tax=Paramecium tetraurelia TaxID=5888 RepID=A0EEP8_PARTE|nr:uncharacterized protein GSPATT00026111001 [Paramecium tetraurelia]CAK93789.1 unnamed protein product [Paramecium tetraurelia]|eukprot:XP_001461162.1 hypothetical protein (macronuclear) [Paramecium tetraurelia strain d4-2]